jgi:hypothetical protein
MRARSLLFAVVTCLALVAPPTARAATASPDLARLRERVETLLSRHAALERRVGRAAVAYVRAAQASDAALARVAEAEAALEARIRTAYQLGPGAALEAFLGAPTLVDIGAISEYAARTVALDERVLADAALARDAALAARERAERRLEALRPELERLRRSLAELRHQLEEAEAAAERARQRAAWLAEQRLALAQAEARAVGWEDLRTLTWGEDQSPYLALLGPTGGRTCETPPGLVATGETFSGYASWYGWEFGGQPTAMGAIFDPTLFTAANRWLPMGTFLRVHAGDRCAIVLVNDRGPYGRLERVLDLSKAAAEYLGVGVTWVRAEVLVVAPPA